MEMSDIELNTTPRLAEYIRSLTGKENDVLRRLREETALLPESHMQISPEQGHFFRFLIQATGARRCLEIGVFTGYSSAWVALALPSDGHVTACDVSAEWTAVARRYWRELGVEHKIDLRLAPAVGTLDRLIGEGRAGWYDFAFIDADKPGYPDYWERALVLVRKGGVIAVDNVLWSGGVADETVDDEGTRRMREFNRMTFADPRVDATLLAMRDGITLACKL
jgi:predicted O-methyltransferase YrrM